MQEQSASNDSFDYERIGRFVYAFHRICGAVDNLTETGRATDAPPALARRAASLAQKFHCMMKNPGSVAEGELASTLDEAAEVQGEIDEWRSGGSRR